MKKKSIIVLIIFSAICVFIYYEANAPKLGILPYPKYKIKNITIRHEGDVGKIASKSE